MAIALSNETHCKICGALYNGRQALSVHVKCKHGIDMQSYYDKYLKKHPTEGKCAYCGGPTMFLTLTDGYKRFCSRSCSTKWYVAHEKESTITCKECGETITRRSYNIATTAFSKHLKEAHGMDTHQYYDKYIKKEGEGVCCICGKPTVFRKFTTGYQRYCSRQCHLAEIRKTQAKTSGEMKAFREEQIQIIKTDEMLQEEWKKEIASRLAEFEGDRETYCHAESDIMGSFGVETFRLY